MTMKIQKVTTGGKIKRTKLTSKIKTTKPVEEKKGKVGREAHTDSVISSTTAQEAIRSEFSLDDLLSQCRLSPGRGRALKDTDNLRIAGSREFVLAALPFFSALLGDESDPDQTYRLHIDTHEKRDSKGKPNGKYIAYIRFREKVEPRKAGRKPKNLAPEGTNVKKTTTTKRASSQPKKDNAAGKAIDAGFDGKRANVDAKKTAKVLKTGGTTPGAKMNPKLAKAGADRPANKAVAKKTDSKSKAQAKPAKSEKAPAKSTSAKKTAKKK